MPSNSAEIRGNLRSSKTQAQAQTTRRYGTERSEEERQRARHSDTRKRPVAAAQVSLSLRSVRPHQPSPSVSCSSLIQLARALFCGERSMKSTCSCSSSSSSWSPRFSRSGWNATSCTTPALHQVNGFHQMRAVLA